MTDRREYRRHYNAQPQNRERARQQTRRWREEIGSAEYAKLRAKYTHGPNAAEALAAMWDAQGGCCYLCGGELDRDKAVVDHDHECCPRRKTCVICRRGFACQRCNRLAGMAGDDVELLRLIADNLERADQAVKARMASAAIQVTLEGVPRWPA